MKMELKKAAAAGTMESSDIQITVEPSGQPGIELELTSSVGQMYGSRIREVIRETLGTLGVENARVTAVDKGALDCTIRARAAAAVCRAAECEAYPWEAK